MPATEETLNAFRDWMTHPDTTIRDLRKNIIKSICELYGVRKIADLGEDVQNAVAKSLGFVIPGPATRVPLAAMQPYTPDPRGPVSNMEKRRAELKEKAAARAAAEHDADLEGDLWTVMGSYTPDKTFLMIWQGRIADDMIEAFNSQHTDAFMILEPALLIGSMSEVRSRAAKQFQGANTNDLTIRVIPRKAQQ